MRGTERESDEEERGASGTRRRARTERERIEATEPEATIDQPERPGCEEVYVVPEPDPESARYRVFVLSGTGHLHHVGAFDLEVLKRSEGGLPAAAIGADPSE